MHTHRAHVPSRLLVVCVNDVQEQRQQTTAPSWRSCILYLVTTSPSVAPDGTNTVSRGRDPRRPQHTHTQVRDVRAHDDAAASRVRSRDGDEKKDLVVVGCNRAAAVPR